MTEQVESRSPEDTYLAGERLAARLAGGDVVLLVGPLGAGKSVFARGVAAGFGETAWRGSPTYNLIHEYRTDPPLYHADLYRLSTGDVEDLGLEEYARPDSVLMVEWADRAPELVAGLAPGRVFQVGMIPTGEFSRTIAVSVGVSCADLRGGDSNQPVSGVGGSAQETPTDGDADGPGNR
jgi:tRNA threonylcarbamoyladenosine biosynthesis protein TsaE